MKKYRLKNDIVELFLKRNDILVVEGKITYLEKCKERTFPFIDVKNTEYFEPVKELFDNGSYVSYKNIVYVVDSFDKRLNGYNLKPYNSKKITLKGISERFLAKVEVYYFLSSKGDVQYDIVGKNKEADIWRKYNNNFFLTKEEAQKEKVKILNKFVNGKL